MSKFTSPAAPPAQRPSIGRRAQLGPKFTSQRQLRPAARLAALAALVALIIPLAACGFLIRNSDCSTCPKELHACVQVGPGQHWSCAHLHSTPPTVYSSPAILSTAQ